MTRSLDNRLSCLLAIVTSVTVCAANNAVFGTGCILVLYGSVGIMTKRVNHGLCNQYVAACAAVLTFGQTGILTSGRLCRINNLNVLTACLHGIVGFCGDLGSFCGVLFLTCGLIDRRSGFSGFGCFGYLRATFFRLCGLNNFSGAFCRLCCINGCRSAGCCIFFFIGIGGLIVAFGDLIFLRCSCLDITRICASRKNRANHNCREKNRQQSHFVCDLHS